MIVRICACRAPEQSGARLRAVELSMDALKYICLLLPLVALYVAPLCVVKPRARARCARSSMQKRSLCPYTVVLQPALLFTLHSVDMCGSLVRHAKTKLRCSFSVAFGKGIYLHPP